MRLRSVRPQGVAVIMAMLTVALISLLCVAAVSLVDLDVERVSGSHDQMQARQLMDDWLERARQTLQEDRAHSTVDHLGEPWAQGFTERPDEQTDIRMTIDDASARFNLNNLQVAGADKPEDSARFFRLLRQLDLSESEAVSRVNTLLDALDRDVDTVRPGGAEADWYASQHLPQRPPNGPLLQIGELFLLRGFADPRLRPLRDWTTVLPEAVSVNVNTAPAEVLMAMIPGLSTASAQSLVEQRQRAWFKDMNDFQARLDPQRARVLGAGLDTRSSYFWVTIRVRHGVSTLRSQTLLHVAEGRPTIVWQGML